MSGQALDLRRSAQIVRRYRTLVGVDRHAGAAVRRRYAAVQPPVKTSTALIVLPVSSHEIATRW